MTYGDKLRLVFLRALLILIPRLDRPPPILLDCIAESELRLAVQIKNSHDGEVVLPLPVIHGLSLAHNSTGSHFLRPAHDRHTARVMFLHGCAVQTAGCYWVRVFLRSSCVPTKEAWHVY